jgi:CO/xanthine dehydrogenase Mo-binding subunit
MERTISFTLNGNPASEAVAGKFAWKAGKSPSGRGAGIACGIYSNAYTAAMAAVAVDRKTGRVQVKRVVSAVDVGLVVDPDGLRQQVEGCITMGLGYTLTEEVHFKDGEVLDRNFDSYRIRRFSWMQSTTPRASGCATCR